MTNTDTQSPPPAAEDASCCAPATGLGLAEPLTAADEELAMFAKALGHPMRVLIVKNLLRVGSCYFGPLADLLPVAPSTAAQHLAVLKESGLVRGEIDGPRPCYCVDLPKLQRFRHLISHL